MVASDERAARSRIASERSRITSALRRASSSALAATRLSTGAAWSRRSCALSDSESTASCPLRCTACSVLSEVSSRLLEAWLKGLLVAIISVPFGGNGVDAERTAVAWASLRFLDQAEQETGHREDGEQDEQDLGDAGGAGCNAAEAEQCGDQRDH